MKFIRSTFLLIVSCLIVSSVAHAQLGQVDVSGLILTASANNPVPGQTVTITATSYSFDVDSSNLVWIVNGVQKQKGVGLKKVDITAPSAGKKTTVNVEVTTSSGGQLSGNIVIGSGSIDMIVETDGYTPPFYKGKFPIVYQNSVKVIAVPHLSNSSGTEYDPSTLTYMWKKDDGTALPDQSGYGKQSITLKGSIVPRPFTLIVTASSRDNTAQGQGVAEISPISPIVVFYNNDPLYGPLLNSAITDTLRIGGQKESGAFASLFGFNDVIGDLSDLKLNWSINNNVHGELSSNKSIVLRAPNGSVGKSIVSLDVSGVSNILQSATGAFTASFSSSNNSSNPVTF